MNRSPRKPTGRRVRNRGIAAAAVATAATAVAAAVLLSGGPETPPASGGPDPAPSAAGGDRVTAAEADAARAALRSVPSGRADRTEKYDRDEFGSGWVDTDDNGCSTRNDILTRDLVETDIGRDCAVRSGFLDDPYTGKRIAFDRSSPRTVQIDHVVPLSLAWQMGADDWDRDRRVTFANDPANLLASDGPANMSKGDSGPGEWMPFDGGRCRYAVVYIRVLDEYGLPVGKSDRDALTGMLAACPGA
ncbi:uncharacterized protein DUF1524 [Murinocardiopsis flavida]|uniref:Uncharacterized protein DUF1524 n=1 Tax=Murinocardiopsis flavida TaxID=645275 RepID=A0A2P8DLR2_9ACTN|nr:HNH endonuclease family protein [Murinocardiopsis flavida]PSK98170.1 uncharacterized protein DUF1524 [Murinocardiopsis flavida]